MLYRNVCVGARVLVHLNEFPSSTLVGTVRYKGGVVLQKGVWIGVELDESVDGHSGLYWGRRYFECRDGHGVFVKSAALDFLPSPRKSRNLYKTVAKDGHVDEDLFGKPLYVTLQGSQPHGPILSDRQLKPKPACDWFQPAKTYNKPHVIGAHIRPATGYSQSPDCDGRTSRSMKLSGSCSRLQQPAWLEDYHCSSPSIPLTHNPLKERHHNMTL